MSNNHKKGNNTQQLSMSANIRNTLTADCQSVGKKKHEHMA